MKYSSNQNAVILSIATALASLCSAVNAFDEKPTVRYGFETVDGLKIFFRDLKPIIC